MKVLPEPVTPPPASDQGTNRIWFAQALRGVAALIVVLEHLTQDWINAQDLVERVAFTEPIKALPRPPFVEVVQQLAVHQITPGIFALCLFFLISGFVIPFSLERRNLRGFVVRRFFRLYPTLWLCIAVTTTFVVLLSTRGGLPYSFATVVTNGLLVNVYTGHPHIDPVYWTLAVEELFYVCAALVASQRLLNRRSTIIVLAGVLAVVAVWIGNPRTPTPANPEVVEHYVVRFLFGFNSTFVIFILVGVVFHQHLRRLWPTRDCLAIGAGIVVLYYVCLENGPFSGNQSAVFFACSFAALAVFFTLYAARDWIPYSRVANGLAEISYPLYLLHTVVGWLLLSSLTRATGRFYVALAITIPAVFVLATIVHLLMERPSMDLGRRITSRPGFRRPDAEAPEAVSPAGTVAGGLP
jgi:peptidoglycan/LPS O-acetylase OafA/YrhL